MTKRKSTEVASIIENIEDEHTCATCAIRHEERRMLAENSPDLIAHSGRYCMPCKHQANRAILDRMMNILPVKKLEIVDNWRPIEPVSTSTSGDQAR